MGNPHAPIAAPAQTLEEQLRSAYELVEQLKEIEVRLRVAIDTALTTYKGEAR